MSNSFFRASSCKVVVTLHAETLLLLSGITLHLLADLDVDVEELGDTAVEADGLALVKVTLAVVHGDTLLGAGLVQTINDPASAHGHTVCYGRRFLTG